MAEPEFNPLPKPRRRRGLIVTFWLLLFVVVLGALGTAGFIAMVGRQLHAPDWVRAQIEARIARNLNGAQITFGGMEFVVNHGWRPRLALRDVELRDAEGRPVARMSRAEASLAMRPLTRGQVQPKQITVSGIHATLRHDENGRIALSFGETAAPVGEAQDLPSMIESWDAVLLQPNFAALTSVQVDSVNLRYENAQIGRAWSLDGGLITLDRDGDALELSAGFSLLSGRDYASFVEANYSSRIGEKAAQFGVTVSDIAAEDVAAQSAMVGWLGVLRAPISGAVRGGISSDGTLSPVSATLQIGAGVVQPTEQSKAIPFDGARTYFTYDPVGQVLAFDELSVDSGWVSGSSEGRAQLVGVENGQLTELVGQLSTSQIRINPGDLMAEPLAPDRVSADFRIRFNPFQLTLGEASLTDDGTVVLADGTLGADETGWHLALNARTTNVTPDKVLKYWPPRAATKGRDWVAANILGGRFSNVVSALRIQPGERPNIAVNWSFDDATIRFLKFQPPITGARGFASIMEDRLSVTAIGGQIQGDQGGAIDVAGTSFIIPNLSIKEKSPAIVRAKGRGSVTSILSLLNRPPLEVLKATPLPVNVADGVTEVTGTVSFPMGKTLPYEELRFHVSGLISDVTSKVLVPGYTLRADTMLLYADQGGVKLSGTGRIDTLPVVMRWQQPIGPGTRGKGGQVQGQVELSQRLIDTFRIGLPDGSVRGKGQGQFTISLVPGKAPVLNVTSDLRGAELRVAELGWRKAPNAAGKLALSATLKAPIKVDNLSLDAAGLSTQGTVAATASGGLDRVVLNSLKIGKWLNASVQIIGRGAGKMPEFRVTKGYADVGARPDPLSGSGGGSTSGDAPLKVSLDQLRITQSFAMSNFHAALSMGASGLRGTFSGRLNGQTPVGGRITPQNGGTAVLAESNDAGGVFRSAGILDHGHGGPFRMSLVPSGPDGHYDGSIRVSDMWVRDAPTMAALLNAISVVGLVNELAGQGILFSEIEARFKLDPKRLNLLSASAVGPSIGLSLDGSYDLKTSRLGMRGVVSPLYLVNAIGSVLTPRKGEGLVGFNFTLTGPSSDPKLQVNPLSGLTPGPLREIFRAGGAPDPTAPDRKPEDGPQVHDPKQGLTNDR